ncbi:MAG: ATP-dependent Clp protease proteolytic subunit [Chloroflexi bacterium]|nr:ATP-dependent Clp protease proteolytic subunit [Chloroflexota bacterium]
MVMGNNLEQMLAVYRARKDELDRQGAYFLSDITDEEAERFSKSMLIMSSQLKDRPNPRITVYINSGGGSVGAGFAMMEMMYKVKRDFSVQVHTVVTGYAYSMGAIIFQAGDRRSMGHFSTLMLHSVSWVVSGEDHRIFKDTQDLARHYQNTIGALFAERTGRHTARWWRNYVYSGHDRFLSAGECLKLGLADEVCSFDQCYMLAPPSAQAAS